MQHIHKKIIIAIVFILILGVIGGGIYFLVKPRSSCFDGIQNQGEERVDCGGPCLPCEPIVSELEVLKVNAIWQEGLRYDIFAKIKNSNSDYGVSSFKYQFNIYNSKGEIIKIEEGKNYILPREGKYIIKNNVEFLEPPSRISFFLKEINWQKLKDFTPLSLTIYDRVLTEEEGNTQLTGTLENQTNYDFNKVEINAVLFDSLENPILVGTHEIRTFLASQKRFFQIIWPRILTNISSIEIKVSTNIFLQENYLKKYGTEEKWHQY